ncbi:MAG TPA: hypothetical protein VMI56_28350, partial [Reyranella sp.]|nr:hypothetical protein [Reyranella sp.]
MLGLLVAACGSRAPAASRFAGTPAPPRGLYYDFSYADAVSALGYTEAVVPEQLENTIRNIDAMGVSRVHIWLNDQPPSRANLVPCGGLSYTTIGFQGRGVVQRLQWPSNLLRAFIERLRADRKTVVLTFSPYVPSAAYIESLAAPDGPLDIARRYPGTEIELDMEENFTEKLLPFQCGPLLSPYAAETALWQRIRAAVPGVQLGVSTTPYRIADHLELIRHADWFVPQLYGNASEGAYDSNQLLEQFEGAKVALDGARPRIWLGLGVHGALREDPAGGTVLFRSLQFAAAQDRRQVPGVVFWSRRTIVYEG